MKWVNTPKRDPQELGCPSKHARTQLEAIVCEQEVDFSSNTNSADVEISNLQSNEKYICL